MGLTAALNKDRRVQLFALQPLNSPKSSFLELPQAPIYIWSRSEKKLTNGACRMFITFITRKKNTSKTLFRHQLIMCDNSMTYYCEQVNTPCKCSLSLINRGAHIQSNPAIEGLIQAGFCVLPGRKHFHQGKSEPRLQALSTCRIKPGLNRVLEDWIGLDMCIPLCVCSFFLADCNYYMPQPVFHYLFILFFANP